MIPEQYSSLEEFLFDDSFVDWVKNSNLNSNSFWNTYLDNNPLKENHFKDAKHLILHLKFTEFIPTLESRKKVWEEISQQIDNDPVFGQKKTIIGNWWAMAASIALIVGLGTWAWLYLEKGNSYETNYGETKTLNLPDGSIVKLNANSTLELSKNWDKNSNREVWLNGEAFFKVTHKNNNQKFIVHTNDKINVEVLGTEFDVLKRQESTEVFLKSGKVRLSVMQDSGKQEVIMKPGELMVFRNQKFKIQKALAKDTLKALEWTKNRIVLDDISLLEMSKYINDIYGLEVKVANKSLLNKRIWGSAPINNIDTLLMGIAKTFDWKIERQGKIITIDKK